MEVCVYPVLEYGEFNTGTLACIYNHMYVYIYVYTHTHTHIYVCMHAYIHTCTHILKEKNATKIVIICVSLYTPINLHTYVQTYMHKHIRAEESKDNVTTTTGECSFCFKAQLA